MGRGVKESKNDGTLTRAEKIKRMEALVTEWEKKYPGSKPKKKKPKEKGIFEKAKKGISDIKKKYVDKPKKKLKTWQKKQGKKGADYIRAMNKLKKGELPDE